MSLKTLLDQLYPQDSQRILNTLTPECNDQYYHQHLPRDWHTHLHFYVTYPDSFIVNGQANLKSLTQQIPHIKDLGCNAIHLLPFFASPLVDGGFDVSNYFEPRPELGNSHDMDEFINQSIKAGIQLFIDLPLNHVSNQHQWFIQAVAGNPHYRAYFIHTSTAPQLIHYDDGPSGHWVQYRVFDQDVSFPVIFPKQSGTLPNWYCAADNCWYFHTFYPHQIDLNWNNPEVFIELSKVIIYWAKKGVNFRLDAAPHLDKQFCGEIKKSTPRNHLLIQALHAVCQMANPFTTFLVEVVDGLDAVKSYLHGSNHKEAELTYNFQILNSIWASVILSQAKHLWEALNKTSSIPTHTQWLNLLRSHDALMLGFLDSNAPNQVHDLLKDKGLPFEGIQVVGRTASFLDENPKKIILAHFLLASLPGNPSIFYGDELLKLNDYAFMKQQNTQKRLSQKNDQLPPDIRDLGRGQINLDIPTTDQAKFVYDQLSQIFHLRLKLHHLHNQHPEKIEAQDQVFAARYYLDFSQTLDVFINLSDQPQTINLPLPKSILLGINQAEIQNNLLNLPPYSGAWIK